MHDDTEHIRRQQRAEINKPKSDRAELETKYGKVWNTEELTQEFDVLGFLAPYVIVRRKDTGEKGSLLFQHEPRFYFQFVADK